ncbi:MAG TPA: glutamate cyclase domain-containing protein [Gemmataceae bacterium]
MTVDDKLRALRDLVQQDVGDRGLARDPARNLVNACPDDFAAACRSIADTPDAAVGIVTGFTIPSVDPPREETDGPPGAWFLRRVLRSLGVRVYISAGREAVMALMLQDPVPGGYFRLPRGAGYRGLLRYSAALRESVSPLTHLIALERVGPNHTPQSLREQGATDEVVAQFEREVPPERRDRCFTMGGRDITDLTQPAHLLFENRGLLYFNRLVTIGIGDGGNEIGMGKIPWDVIRRNIPNGGLIACRVPTDYLIVAGVSNWGAFALGAGVALLRGERVEPELFDLGYHRLVLEEMARAAGLVDGVTGRTTATVDGLSFEQYARVLPEMGRIVNG